MNWQNSQGSYTNSYMNWQGVTFDWNQTRAFLVTAEEGSLSAAARALGLTQPTLGRQVAALEETLGVMLFERAGKALILTESGRELLDQARAMGEAANRVSLIASGQSQTIEGYIKITATDLMSIHAMPRILHELRKVAPKLEVEVISANAIQDLMRREADIAIRHVRPEQPDLIARLVREATGSLYAARSYIAEHGRPKTPADLINHEFVGFDTPEQMARTYANFDIPFPMESIRVTSHSGVVGWELIKQGFGIGIMDDEIATATPEVERLLPDLPPIKYPVWLTTHRELHTSRRIRLVFDLLADQLARPWA